MIRRTASRFIILVALSLLVAATGWAQAEFPAVLFEQPSHFTAPDGTDVLVAAGTYRVEQSAATQLKLVADLLQPAIEIQATATTHEEALASPLALTITEEGQEDEVHLLLLLPDGPGLDAMGTFSGTRSRAARRVLSATQIRARVARSAPLFSSPVPPTVVYGIAPTGALLWYRHNGAPTGTGLNSPGAWSGPTEVGSGWQDFIQVVPGGGEVLYGIARDGTLKWYSHNGAVTGTPAWQGAKNVGTGWQNFKQVFSGSEGILYAIAQDGTLKWYRHTGYRDGAATWDGPRNVGTGWQNFKTVFGMGDGVIYAIAGDGKLKWYKHVGFRDGTVTWEGPKDVGTGWQNFKQVFVAGNGLIYAIAQDGILKWYKHLGYRDGTFAWEGAKNIGTGWQGFPTVVALLPPGPAAAVPAPQSSIESVETSGPGNWVTWNYLAMHHPEIVAQALADVQTNTQPRTSIAGLASDVELTAMLKTDWTAEVNRLALMGAAGGPRGEIAPRGLPSDLFATDLPPIAAAKRNFPSNAIPSDYDQATAIPSEKRSPASQAIINELFALTLPPQNLGSVWAGQSAFAYVFITAPVDGYIEGRFNLNATNRHFRIVNAKAYSGEVVNGTPVVSLTIPGGQYQDVVLDPAHPPAQISKAGFVAILAKKGQLIVFTVAFDPVGLGMTPVGNNEATLELSGATSTDINILSPNAPVTTWRRMASILARFEGINFGVLGAMSDTAITVFYDGTPCNARIPVPATITFHNAEQQARSISVTAELSHPLHMQGITVSLAPGERKQVSIPIQIDSCPNQGVAYKGRLSYAYAGVVRQIEFGVTLYPKLLHWYKNAADVGSCRYSWEIYAQPDGTTRFAYSLRNTSLVSEMQLDFSFLLLGVKVGSGVLMDGQNTVHTKFSGYKIQSSFVRDNYPRLFGERAQGKLRCHTR